MVVEDLRNLLIAYLSRRSVPLILGIGFGRLSTAFLGRGGGQGTGIAAITSKPLLSSHSSQLRDMVLDRDGVARRAHGVGNALHVDLDVVKTQEREDYHCTQCPP